MWVRAALWPRQLPTCSDRAVIVLDSVPVRNLCPCLAPSDARPAPPDRNLGRPSMNTTAITYEMLNHSVAVLHSATLAAR